MHAHFTSLKNALMGAKNTYKAINEKLGTDFATNAYNQQTVVSLFELIRSNVILNKIWFSSDIAKIRTLVIDAQAVSNDIKSVKEKLLAVWEPEILDLDFAPILLRYKTEYTNIFKVFKGQYKQDKKQIALHAYKLEFTHPVKCEKLVFQEKPTKNDAWKMFKSVK